MFTNGQLEPALAACIGPGTATMFLAFLELNKSSDLNVDVAQVLRGKARAPKLSMEKPDVAWALTARITGAVQQSPESLSSAIQFYCSAAWKDVREIGRTGLADLKYLVDPKELVTALAPRQDAFTKLYGGLLS
jgi:hypothetical protein